MSPRARLACAAALIASACSGTSTAPGTPGAEEPGATDPTARALETLAGTWADAPEGYAYGEAFGRRVFTFDAGRWTLDFTLALDPQHAVKVFRFRTHGTYDVLGPSAQVAGAYEALFREEQKLLTLETGDPQLARAFGFDACGLVPGVEKDVSVEGCLGWRPVAVCGEDHDLLALTPEGGLRFGVRPPDNDMCTAAKRPTALTPPVLPQARGAAVSGKLERTPRGLREGRS